VSGVELELVLRCTVAAALGYVVGLERKYVAHRDAGSSTFALIALAAAVVTAMAFQLFDTDSASRLMANIMVGVGFIGGGTIVKQSDHIRGLTTAAGIWAMASVGMLVGAGQYGLGIAVSVLVLLLFGAEFFERRVNLS
jgi:putative Mg2+ transporter-C (MgtC) family protein